MPKIDTKLALMRTAERLFAERGVDRVSVAEINQAADQKNRSAVQYHFGDKHGLLEAIVGRHSVGVQQAWLDMLSVLESKGVDDAWSVLEVLVLPMVQRLDDPDNGREYILVASQLVGHPKFSLFEAPTRGFEGATEIATRLIQKVDLPPALLELRMYRVMEILFHSVADYARTRGTDTRPSVDRELFVADLVDSLHALVMARPSEKTLALLRENE